MRVLLINKFHYKKGGAERAYFDTAHILAEKGHPVAFFAMEHPDNEPTPWAQFFVSSVDYLDEKQSFFSKARIGLRLIWNFEAVAKLEALIKEFRPEVAHLHNIYHQLSPAILWTLKKHGIPIVMTLHDYKAVSPNYSLFVRGKIWPHTSGWRCIIDRAIKDSWIRSVNCAIETWLHRALGSFAQVSAFIAPSHFLIDEYQKLGFSYPIEYVPQPLFPFPAKPAELAGGEYFLFVGRLSVEKGVQSLLEAFTELTHERLVIVGTGPDEARLRKFQKEEGMSQVTFAGYQTGESLHKLFRNAKALILPSVWYENMPYVMLEAFGFGKPVIGSRLGGIPERIHDGVNGMLFEAGDSHDLARAIRAFTAKNTASMSQKAWESIQDLTAERYGEKLIAVYQSVMSPVDKNQKE